MTIDNTGGVPLSPRDAARQRSLRIASVYPGPVRTLSGPGTGKTHLLGLRVKCLVEAPMNVTPDQIAVITFTDEAMRNMRLRLSDRDKADVYLEKAKQPKLIRTMHGLGQMIIRSAQGEQASSPSRLVSSDRFWTTCQRLEKTSERDLLLRDAAFLAAVDAPAAVAKAASRCRTEGECRPCEEARCRACDQYKRILAGCCALDHDEQIVAACDALDQDVPLLRNWQHRAYHLLVDEYQDINQPQFRLIELLSRAHREGLFVVGDDDQSIYAFRGGTPKFIRDFADNFPGARLESLDHNWRCPPEVMQEATAVVSRFSPSPLAKPAYTFEADRHGRVEVHSVPTDKTEAELVRAAITDLLPARDILVLVPYRRVADLLQDELGRSRIAYDGRRDASEYGISTVGALTRWVENQDDSVAARVCAELIAAADSAILPSRLCKTAPKVAAREEAMLVLANVWTRAIADSMPYFRALASMVSESPILGTVQARMDELLNSHKCTPAAFAETLLRIAPPWRTCQEMSAELVGLSDDVAAGGGAASGGVVRVMTYRQAKGLEADAVVILGLEDDLFPGGGRVDDPVDLEESARLLYVSMTRAKEKLMLFHTRAKRSGATTFGGENYAPSPCRFLDAVGVTSTYHGSSRRRARGPRK